ncbi:hypothetical protein CQW23_17602 [Capsicum baccatum]|uniref:Uncharacterized protein n=1 Tax=Capsicum baccatum TaxID=33114 RepID=A0A2G2WED2_CAPBA|nr:hypothetical protein CQW23_17602 [Capsicum baccatum]
MWCGVAHAPATFWDLKNWSVPGTVGTRGKFDEIEGNSFKVVETEEQIELSFTRTWDPSLQDDHSPLTIDKRFRYMAMADDRERLMPLPEDGVPLRGKELAYTEAVLLVG